MQRKDENDVKIDLFFKDDISEKDKRGYEEIEKYEKDRKERNDILHIMEAYDCAKAQCANEIYSILDEMIKPKLDESMKNATNDYIKLYWNKLTSEETLRKRCDQRFELMRKSINKTGVNGERIRDFLNDKDHPNVDLKSLKYLFIHHFFNITANTNSEAAKYVDEIVSNTMNLENSLELVGRTHCTTGGLFGDPSLLSFILQYNQDITKNIVERINNLYPGLKMGNELIQIIIPFPKEAHGGGYYVEMQEKAWNTKTGLASKYPYEFPRCSKTEFYFFYKLFDTPFKCNKEYKIFMKDVCHFLSQAVDKGITDHSLAYHLVSAILNNKIGKKIDDKDASLLVEKFNEALKEKLYPNYKQFMLFKHAAANELPTDVIELAKQNLHDLNKKK